MATTSISRAGFGDRTGNLPPTHLIFGRSPSMQTARQKIDKVAQSGVPILIQGVNGTGKGLLASFIHNLSPKPGAAFVKVNCAAIPGALLESELFVYEKGAFTGAHSAKPERGAYFLQVHRARHKMQARPLSAAALNLLLKHSWPGNIRELENLIERYVILGSEDAISTELLNWEQTHADPEIPIEGQIHLK